MKDPLGETYGWPYPGVTMGELIATMEQAGQELQDAENALQALRREYERACSRAFHAAQRMGAVMHDAVTLREQRV